MGLLLGGSVLTVCELLDLLIFNFFKKLTRRRETEEKMRQREIQREQEEREKRQKEAAKAVSSCPISLADRTMAPCDRML